jgi:two-component system sensor histidine kinase TctE
MVSGFARQAAERTQDNILVASASIIAEALRSENSEVRLELPYAAFSMLGAISEDRVFYYVTAAGETLTGTPELGAASSVPSPGQTGLNTISFQDEPLRVASITRLVLVGPEPVPVTVYVGQTRNGVSFIAGDLSRTAALLSVAFFIVAVALSAIVARASLRKLNIIADAVARRGPSDLRPLRENPPDELAPLVSSLNRLIERLARSLRQSEDFIAEAAHRVRTPLAIVRAQAEVALHSVENPDDKNRMRGFIRAVDESSRSAGQLLDHATVAYRSEDLPDTPVDMAQVVRAATAGMQPTADMKDIDISLQVEQTLVRGDEVLLESALRNILDNAVKYSPAESRVIIKVRTVEGMAQVTVSDKGSGLGKGPYQKLTDRFHRGENSKGTVGSGLGLTIARDVLVAHGGRLDLFDNDGIGTCVSLTLPSA